MKYLMDIKNYYLYYRVSVPSTVTRASHPARKIEMIVVIPQQLQQRMQRICDRRGSKETIIIISGSSSDIPIRTTCLLFLLCGASTEHQLENYFGVTKNFVNQASEFGQTNAIHNKGDISSVKHQLCSLFKVAIQVLILYQIFMFHFLTVAAL